MAPHPSAAPSTPRQPRAAPVPPMVPPSPSAEKPQGSDLSSISAVHHQCSPPSGMSNPGITSTAQGPLRHPKPLTPSDLHSTLEKEQEAMVNRLTRELSLLRQQTASVASTTSSTSTFNEPTDAIHASPSLNSPQYSHASRRQRSSSSLSSHGPAAQSTQAASVTGIAPLRDSIHHSRSADHPHARTTSSREPSLTSRRPSIGSITSHSQFGHSDPFTSYASPSVYPHRNSLSQTHLGLSSNPLARYEEATLHKTELETIKRENEQLKKRVRELEGILKKQTGAENGSPVPSD